MKEKFFLTAGKGELSPCLLSELGLPKWATACLSLYVCLYLFSSFLAGFVSVLSVWGYLCVLYRVFVIVCLLCSSYFFFVPNMFSLVYLTALRFFCFQYLSASCLLLLLICLACYLSRG
ncbi:hypothetical protein KP509_29G013900 [Ceratopteris richardii]|uniref:Uncharacterized protein n=1 Tax=Ceratopteris richardii TaxID=49495 RepID=A0A8T2R4Q6_CERRI|nr:hypothetical protein KP509_29G013900 [Ceratopteris richardii]